MQLPLVWTPERSRGSGARQQTPTTRHSSQVSVVPDKRWLNTHLIEALKVLGTIKIKSRLQYSQHSVGTISISPLNLACPD